MIIYKIYKAVLSVIVFTLLIELALEPVETSHSLLNSVRAMYVLVDSFVALKRLE